MELIFMYIELIKERGFENVGLNFSRRYKCSVVQNQLIIKNEEYPSYLEGFYGARIKNVTLLLGDNGVGKTTILDRIGLPLNERLNRIKRSDKFFFVYKVDDKKFVIETHNCDILTKDRFENAKMESSYIALREGDSLVLKEEYEVSSKNVENITFYYGDDEKQYRLLETNEIVLNDDEGSYWLKRAKMSYSNLGLFELCNSKVVYEFTNFEKIQFAFEFYSNSISEYFFNSLITDGSCIYEYDNLLSFSTSSTQRFSTTYLYNLFMHMFQKYYCEIKFIGGDRKFVLNDEYSESLLNKFKICRDEFSQINSYEEALDYLLSMLDIIIPSTIIMDKEETKKFFHALEKIDDFYIDYKNMSFCITDKTDNNVCFFNEYDKLASNEYSFNFMIYKSLRFELLKMKVEDGPEADIKIRSSGKTNYFKLFRMSSGETHMLSFLSRLSSIITKKYDKKTKNVTILLDEPEEKFHPEWNRQLFNCIIKLINKDNRNIHYSLVIASHSPFLASDILKEDIICLKKEKNVIVLKSDFGFGSEISNILSSNFFMEYHIGEFAKDKILELKKDIESNHDLNVDDVMKKIDCITDERIAMYLIELISKSRNNEIYKLRKEKEMIEKKIKLLEEKNDKTSTNSKRRY